MTAVLVLAALLLLVMSAAFRRLAALLVLLGIIAVAVLWTSSRQQTDEEQARLVAQRRKILPKDIALNHLRVRWGGGMAEVSGRLANRAARDSVESVDISVTLYDCATLRTPLSQCTVVANDRPSILETVPPAQSRDFEVPAFIPNALRIHGRPRWTYRVVGITARSP